MNQVNDEPVIADALCAGEAKRLAIADVRGNGLTYGELRDLVGRTHAVLAKWGINRDDTVAFSLTNGPETAALFLALASYCRVAPLNPTYTAREMSFSLADLEARALIARPANALALEAAGKAGVLHIALEAGGALSPGAFRLHTRDDVHSGASTHHAPGADNIALLLHTSGTTARPKLVALTQRSLCLSAKSVSEVLRLSPDDRALNVMPFFHIHGLVAGLLASISAGATICCAPGFQATSFFSWLESSQATWYTGVPTMHQAILLRSRHNSGFLSRHKLRLIRSSSSPLFPVIWEKLETAFGVPVLNAYGMTEAAHQISSVRLGYGPRFRGSVGLSTGSDIAVLDKSGAPLPVGKSGEVALRGPQIISSYLRPGSANQDAFVNGWLRTGDEGFLGADGMLTLCGRIKEMINSGGEKVSPYEVEEALLDHPSVAQAVAFAAPHALLGEEVAAAVVVREGCQLGERELFAVAGSRLARCKMPRRVFFVADIPRGATGKLQRIGLANRLGLIPADPC
jgi:acyl-CoA synthetase (AMP-forming)/AMP-acid ligase II